MMEKFCARKPVSFNERCRALNAAAHAVRQDSIQTAGGDFDAWRLSRLMREAETDAQVYSAEQQYAVWLHEQLSGHESVIVRWPGQAGDAKTEMHPL